MVSFFRLNANKVFAVGSLHPLPQEEIGKLIWLLSDAQPVVSPTIEGPFVGPRKEMITPWSTNAVEITQNMGIRGITRMEEFMLAESVDGHDPMLQHLYPVLDQEVFTIRHRPEPIQEIKDIAAYSAQEGLALSKEEIDYLNEVSRQLGRSLTDSEVFGFSQVNSEHCRHKIFNGTFILDGVEQPVTLFQLIKKTSKENPNRLVSAYRDNVAFIEGPRIEQFAPHRQDVPDYFEIKDIDSVLSLKAETHNFPTTVEPFNGAATGSGGEIRDRLAGGKGSLPLAGTAVYITSYPRLDEGRKWENGFKERKWLYHNPAEILIRASDGASDFGNKFGQPLICGSLLTFEHMEQGQQLGFDKVIMLAGGVGFGKKSDSQKGHLKAGDKIVLLGGDNYRIGMGGGAVSSVATGEYGNAIELNAVQRSNPEMQKRVMNAIRAMVESDNNPIVSIHDHGAGGHLNCFSELLEETGGHIHLNALPIGDPTLSDKELISNESQERMGLALHEENLQILKRVAERERAPFYVVGEATGNHKFVFAQEGHKRAIDFSVSHLFGSSPKTIITDTARTDNWKAVVSDESKIMEYIEQVLQLESVACKDWLTNKVDRSVTGKVATQQTCGAIQLPLNNVGVMALDFASHKGVATAIGHAPVASLIDPAAGGRLAIAESLTNLVWAPLTHGLKGVSLSANWMWPCKNSGEDQRLYAAVKAVSDFAIQLGINIPTGKDSLSMTQKYPNGQPVIAPGTVIISAMAEVDDIRKTISTAVHPVTGSMIIYVPFTKDKPKLGGTALAQVMNLIGNQVPEVADADYFGKAFNAIQKCIHHEIVLAGHDVSSGGLLTALLEMLFPTPDAGMDLQVTLRTDLVTTLFHESPGVLLQTNNPETVSDILKQEGLTHEVLGSVNLDRKLKLNKLTFDVDWLRAKWFHTSFLLDAKQRPREHAQARFDSLGKQPLNYRFPKSFDGTLATYGIAISRRERTGIRAAIIREKGVNGDREMAYSLYLAGFDVKDVHMTDLIAGREDLSNVNMIVFVGGFSNSDVLGSAKGWAGAFLYNEKAKRALDNFYNRKDTLSLGVCNGCQLVMELGLIDRKLKNHPRMHHNGSGKFESTFVNLTIPKTNSILLKSLVGSQLGVWVAHGEGRFRISEDLLQEGSMQVAATYSYDQYPGNPNDSDFAIAALSSADGRHLGIMPHIERSLFPWNWPFYPHNRKDEISPWIEAFVNAREWVKNFRSPN
jgi:phosphoribosylformylglycinamidine synthase